MAEGSDYSECVVDTLRAIEECRRSLGKHANLKEGDQPAVGLSKVARIVLETCFDRGLREALELLLKEEKIAILVRKHFDIKPGPSGGRIYKKRIWVCLHIIPADVDLRNTYWYFDEEGKAVQRGPFDLLPPCLYDEIRVVEPGMKISGNAKRRLRAAQNWEGKKPIKK